MKNEEERDERGEIVIYHADSSSIAPQISTHSISYFWKEALEEPSNREILPYIKTEIIYYTFYPEKE